MGHFLVELNALDPQRKPNIATTLNPVRWIALGRTGATGHLVQRLVVQATRYVPGTRIQHAMVERNVQDPRTKTDHATQAHALWIALGKSGASGQHVPRHVVQARRDVGERQIQNAMVERSAQDPRTKTDHATQAHARWIALGQTGAAGQGVQGHVVLAHRDVGEGQIQHSMVERNAQDPQMNADCATLVDV